MTSPHISLNRTSPSIKSKLLPHTMPSPGPALQPAEPDRRSATVLSFAGGAGGLGASTLAVASAIVAAERKLRVLLIDGDHLGGGLDLLLGLESLPGLRWPDLHCAQGQLPAESLHAALPRLGSLAVLASARGEPQPVPQAAWSAVLDAGRRGHDLVIVDLPRSFVAFDGFFQTPDQLCLLVSGRIPAVAAAAQYLAQLGPASPGHSAILRRRSGDSLSRHHVQIALGLPVLAEIRDDQRLPALGERGQSPGLSHRGSLRRAATRCLAELSFPGGS